jgi:hypothetical protein
MIACLPGRARLRRRFQASYGDYAQLDWFYFYGTGFGFEPTISMGAPGIEFPEVIKCGSDCTAGVIPATERAASTRCLSASIGASITKPRTTTLLSFDEAIATGHPALLNISASCWANPNASGSPSVYSRFTFPGARLASANIRSDCSFESSRHASCERNFSVSRFAFAAMAACLAISTLAASTSACAWPARSPALKAAVPAFVPSAIPSARAFAISRAELRSFRSVISSPQRMERKVQTKTTIAAIPATASAQRKTLSATVFQATSPRRWSISAVMLAAVAASLIIISVPAINTVYTCRRLRRLRDLSTR